MNGHVIITAADIAQIMLGRTLRTPEIISELEARLNFRCDSSQRGAVSDAIFNMRRSKKVEIDVVKKKVDDVTGWYWHLKAIQPSYFRKCSMTRKLKAAGRVIKNPAKTPREKPERKRTTVQDVHEINVCRLARALDNAWRHRGWVEPELLTVKKYERRKKGGQL